MQLKNCIYRGRFAKAPNFCNFFKEQLRYTKPSCHEGSWQRRFYDAAVSHRLQGLSASVICYHFMTVCNSFIQVSFPILALISSIQEIILFRSMIVSQMKSNVIWRRKRTESMQEQQREQQMRWNASNRASSCQQQSRSPLAQSSVDANIPQFHSERTVEMWSSHNFTQGTQLGWPVYVCIYYN